MPVSARSIDSTGPSESGDLAEPTGGMLRWLVVMAVSGCGNDVPVRADAPILRGPLKDWMETELQAALASENFGALARSFVELGELDLPGMSRWDELARAGARAATVHDLDAVRAACRDCHRAYRTAYRKQRRTL
jgi:hypothetical protein